MTKLDAVKISWIMEWYFGSYACAKLVDLNCLVLGNWFLRLKMLICVKHDFEWDKGWFWKNVQNESCSFLSLEHAYKISA